MKQVINQGGEIKVEDVPAPLCEDNQILVRNGYSLISAGTETTSLSDEGRGIVGMASQALNNTELIAKAIDLVREEGLAKAVKIIREHTGQSIVPLGYSCSGRVIQVGHDVNDVAVGDRVACAGAGYANHAEVVTVPRNLAVKIPDEVDLEEAAFTTLGSVAMQGVRRAEVEFGSRVVVMGLGLIGLLVTQILNAAGARVMGIDLLKERLKLAQELGAQKCFISGDEALDEVLKYTEGVGADSVIICAATRSSEPVRQAMHMARRKGKVVVVGDVGMEIDRSPFYEKELDFLISCSYGPGRYDKTYEEKGTDYPVGYVRWTENRNMQEFLNLVQDGKVRVKELIDGMYPIQDASEAYASFDSDKRPVGVLFQYEDGEEKVQRKIRLKPVSTDTEKINLGFIGAGSFAQTFHLPNLKKMSDVNLSAIVTRTGVNAKTIAEEYGAEYYTTDYREVLEDDDIDMVMIATRHHLHAPLIQDAASSGKHIFVEKPIAMNYEECRRVYRSVKDHKVNLAVGFNRRLSPLTQEVRKFLADRKNPLIITYRVNSAEMKKDHWINDPKEGGGAIIGEACHFFDLLNWMVGSDPVSIYAEMISSQDQSIVDSNNLISTLKYEDGSIASVVYNTIGDGSFSKERIEIFSDGRVILIDDFQKLVVSGEKTLTLKEIDKGHFKLLDEYIKLLLGKSDQEDIPTVEDGVKATLCSLLILDALKTGEVQKFEFDL